VVRNFNILPGIWHMSEKWVLKYENTLFIH